MGKLNPAFRAGAFTDLELWHLNHGIAVDDARFWRNFAALARFAGAEPPEPFEEDRQRALEPLMKRHWCDRALGRTPWQVRERRGEELQIPKQRTPADYRRSVNHRGGR